MGSFELVKYSLINLLIIVNSNKFQKFYSFLTVNLGRQLRETTDEEEEIILVQNNEMLNVIIWIERDSEKLIFC